jgi:phosphoadenosine phosphosulfate reductase
MSCKWCQNCLKRLSDSDLDFAQAKLEEDYYNSLSKYHQEDSPRRKQNYFKRNHQRHVCIECWDKYSHVGWCFNCKEAIICFKNTIDGSSRSICPVCNKELTRLASDLRPVFARERAILLFYNSIDQWQFYNSDIWRSPQNPYYFVDGHKVNFPSLDIISNDAQSLNDFINSISELEETDLQILERYRKTVTVNDYVDKGELVFNLHMTRLEENARLFLTELKKEYADLPLVISFSGGKDSTVIADLVKKQLGLDEIDIIFNNTTIEQVQTIQYVKSFAEDNELKYLETCSNNIANGRKFFYHVTPKNNFSHIVREIGPPSRGVRWCCSVFKANGINEILQSWGGKVLTIYGIRNSESVKRSFYCPVTDQGKIGIQVTASPIISWSDFEIWLYIFKHNLAFNDLYRYGFNRVGCWLCPMNSKWSDILNKIYFPSRYNNWREFLINYAKELGKPDPEEYVDAGNWKKRFGGSGRANSFKGIRHKICGLKEDTIQYNLKRVVEKKSVMEYFKPFGYIDLDFSNPELGIYQIKVKKCVEKLVSQLILEVEDGGDTVRVTYSKPKNLELIKAYVKYQLTKYEVCIRCTACELACPFGAINVDLDSDEESGYSIDERICWAQEGCLECTWHFESSGCLIAKSLSSSGGNNKDDI